MALTATARNTEGEQSAGCYQRHRPEQTLLYRIVEQHYPVLIEHMAESIALSVDEVLPQRPIR